MIEKRRVFVFYFFFVSFSQISIGINLSISLPNIEIHLPFGFIKIGFDYRYSLKAINYDEIKKRTIGIYP